MGRWIESVGGSQRYISGLRTSRKQEELFNTPSLKIVAIPGCSQHEYGFAVDVFWLPIIDFRLNIQLTGRQTNELMEEIGRRLGLLMVQGDPGHFQVFPGSEFRNWAVRSGLCDPNRIRVTSADLIARDPSVRLFGEFATTFTCNKFGCFRLDVDPFPNE